MASLDPMIARMQEVGERLVADNDERQHFHGAYLRSTLAVKEDVRRRAFLDPPWAERWGLVFAQLYMKAFDAWERGDETPGPWRVAFEAARDPVITPLRHALLGINAHINYDLPQALIAIISESEFDDPEVMKRRAADHAHVDSILVRRVPSEDKELAKVEEPGDRTIVDRLLQPFNRWGTRRFLREGRAKVWGNTRVLDAARRRGPEAYAADLARLEELSRERVADLVAPRYVLISLARHGFGVALSPNEAA
jgi:hypothetical protein